jgi:hypothetical protein
MAKIRVGNLRAKVLLAILLTVVPAYHASASVIYEFREVGSSTPTAFLEFASPPASDSTGWSTSDPADLLSFTCDCLYPLGVLPAGSTVTLSVSSPDGSRLDSGFFDVFYTIPPVNPGDSLIEGVVNLSFDALLHGDTVSASAQEFFPDGSFVIIDFFTVEGDWTLQRIPEPTTGALLAIGLVMVGNRIRRARRDARPD